MQLLADIVGATAYNENKARHISGISVRSNKLSIRLRAPEGAFASRLAEAFFCPVPIGTPVVPGGVTRPIPSAGPYYVASSALGQTVLLRNPNYHGARPRRIERIVYTSSVPSAKAVALVDSGAAEFVDGYTTDADPGALATTSGAARHKGRYVVVPVPFIDAIAFNTKRPLFRDARMRRAVSFSIDRRALAAVFDEPPTDRYIPPAIPGFQSGHVYPPAGDLAEAKRLAGPGSHRAVLYSCGPPANVTPSVEQIIRSNLARIGIRVQIERSLGCLNGPDTKKREEADMALVSPGDNVGDPAWTIRATLGLSPDGVPGYWNDPVLRRRIERAEALQGRARIREFARLDEILVRDAAPFAPYGSFTVPEYFSPQVGCKVFQATYHFVDLGALCVRKG
jgi:ABC-type transport system substrate-binding protein